MNGKDKCKVFNAGFTIIRQYEYDKVIKKLTPQKSTVQGKYEKIRPNRLSWQKMAGPFESKAAMHRAADELLEDEMTIED